MMGEDDSVVNCPNDLLNVQNGPRPLALSVLDFKNVLMAWTRPWPETLLHIKEKPEVVIEHET